MKLKIVMTNGKIVKRTDNFTSVKQDIAIDRLIWRFFCDNNTSLASHEIPDKALKSFTFSK